MDCQSTQFTLMSWSVLVQTCGMMGKGGGWKQGQGQLCGDTEHHTNLALPQLHQQPVMQAWGGGGEEG